MDLLLQDSAPFLCEGGYSEPTEPPGYEPAQLLGKILKLVSLSQSDGGRLGIWYGWAVTFSCFTSPKQLSDDLTCS